MTALQPGDKFPEGISFTYVPYVENADINTCGRPIKLDVSKEWADKKFVIFAVPGAFTPTCSEAHLPGYIENLPKLKEKGVDFVAVIAYNDPYVMNAWSKSKGIKNDDIYFMSDNDLSFSKSMGWTMGERAARYALAVDKGTVVYAAKEQPGQLDVSTAGAVLTKL